MNRSRISRNIQVFSIIAARPVKPKTKCSFFFYSVFCQFITLSLKNIHRIKLLAILPPGVARSFAIPDISYFMHFKL